MSSNSDEMISIIDDSPETEKSMEKTGKDSPVWNILVVDDEQVVHEATEFALKYEIFFGRPAVLHHASSAKEGLDYIISSGIEFVVALIDVVMETTDAGLKLVRQIRENGYTEMRIILRTGQPGYAPELSVLKDYDINDYRTKNELTKSKLLAVLLTAFRSYQQIRSINTARRGLEHIIEATADLFQQRNIELFAKGVLTQITSLLGKQTSGLVSLRDSKEDKERNLDDFRIISSTGTFQKYTGRHLSDIDDPLMINEFKEACCKEIVTKESGSVAMHIKSYQGNEAFLFIDCGFELSDDNITLLRIFGVNIFSCFNNINFIRKLDEMAYTDTATGLPNMNALKKELQALIEEQGKDITLILIHLNELGKIYSLFGTETVNQIFKKTYRIISKKTPRARMVALSAWGDYAVLMNTADYRKEDIRTLTSISIKINENEMYLVTSIVSAPSLPGDTVPENIIQRANLTLTHGKTEHRGELLEYDNIFAEHLKKSIYVQYNLRESFKKESAPIEVFLQPKFDTLTNRIVGAEALSRWKIDGNYIPPTFFIPILEQSGLSLKLVDRLLDSVGQWQKTRKLSNLPLFPVSVNLTMKDFLRGDYAEHLLTTAEQLKLNPDLLEFEITEGVMMRNPNQTIQELNQLKSAGYRIAVDDFGTGYSSLSYLDQLPVDILKIDRAFVLPLTPLNARRSIVATIVAMAESLGLDVVAEGIETPEHSQALQFLGCHICQGYLFGKPTNIKIFDSAFSGQFQS